MDLVKLTIKPLSPSKLAPINVLFNPNSYSIVKPVTWQPDGGNNRGLDAPTLAFGGGGNRVLTLQLFFDVTEGINGKPVPDVRSETNKIVALTRIERVNDHPQPPVCSVDWGEQPPPGSDFPFVGVVTSLNQTFTLFRSTGQPVRANLTVTFMEALDAVMNKKETDPDVTTYLVKRGDSLSTIAARVYRDATRWRVIAEANRIDDPRRPPIGKRLDIPKVT
jgi:hypothetical protein